MVRKSSLILKYISPLLPILECLTIKGVLQSGPPGGAHDACACAAFSPGPFGDGGEHLGGTPQRRQGNTHRPRETGGCEKGLQAAGNV